MGHHEQPTARRSPEQEESFLAPRVIRIRDRSRKRIPERFDRFFERHRVLGVIQGGFEALHSK